MSEDRFVCGCVLSFSDGGPDEEQVYGRGTHEECVRIGKLIAGVSYSGPRPIKDARFVIVPEAQ